MDSNHPIVLYKYKDVSEDTITHVEDMLRNNRLWFSSPNAFTDPFDCRCVYEIGNTREEVVLSKMRFLTREGASLSGAIAKAEQDIPRLQSELEEWLEQRIKDHSRRAANTGILCLTRVCDNPLMWTHYAKGHTGICIKFRCRDVHEDSHIDFLASAFSVEYIDRCPLINFVRDDWVESLQKAFLTKATPYHYEAEWRIVRYDEGEGFKPIPKGIISGIILGVQIDPKIRHRVIQACTEYDGNVDIFQAALAPNTYGLRVELEKTV